MSRTRPWHAWPTGRLVYLGDDRSELYAVVGHTAGLVVAESLASGERETVGPSRLTAAAGGDDAVLRHAWPLGTEVHYQGGIYTVTGYQPCPGMWFGRLALKPADGGEEIRTTTDVVVPRTQTPAWMRGG